MCEHKSFKAKVVVNRMVDTGHFMAEVAVGCEDCGLPFEFLGLDAGLDMQGAMVSIDGLEARLAISPKGARPNPLQRMGFGIEKFDA